MGKWRAEGAEDRVLTGISSIFDIPKYPVLMIEPRETSWDSVRSILTPLGHRPFRCDKGGRLATIYGLEDAKCYLAVWSRALINTRALKQLDTIWM